MLPDRATCLQCGYPLKNLAHHECPECGRPFDPESRETFGPVRKHFLVIPEIVLLSLAVLFFLFGGWFVFLGAVFVSSRFLGNDLLTSLVLAGMLIVFVSLAVASGLRAASRW